MDRYFATTRQVTGDPMRHYAYVMDRETGKPVRTCNHNHRSRLGCGGMNGEHYAMECAKKMLRKLSVERASDDWCPFCKKEHVGGAACLGHFP